MAHSFLVNDPEHAPPFAPWLRGITPVRFGCFLAACVLLAARPALWHANFDEWPEALLRWFAQSKWWFFFGLPLFVLVVKADAWTATQRPSVRIASLAFAVFAGAVIFSMQVWALAVPIDHPDRWQWHLGFFLRALTLGSLMAAILHFARREGETRRALHSLQMAEVDIARRTNESKLRLLHAQIEPHFLFNSLASVKRLFEREPGSGRAMLRSLVSYVKMATARSGEAQSRLCDEIALAKAFLEIFQVRMGSRLRVRMDVPPHLENALVPSLAIGTLVENAIKHDIGPRASGGDIHISARIAERQLLVEVRDNGVGFRARSGHGIGLANIRARLETLFRGAATLELAANRAGGVTASLTLPCRFA